MLDIRDLRIAYPDRDGGEIEVLRGLDLSLAAGASLGVVGESGSGKSQTALAVMGLLAGNARVTGSIRFEGQELVGLAEAGHARLRGQAMAMVFQDPMTALNPYLRIGRQMTEVLEHHQGMSRASARGEALRMLDAVRIAAVGTRLNQYPHELSGGMRQRVMIAMSLLCRPRLLLADEPTTALDVTVQAQILELLMALQRDLGLAIMLITHDLGIVAERCARTAVFYAGRLVEAGDTTALLRRPRHPYTEGLLRARPRLDLDPAEALPAMPGAPPEPGAAPEGCPFSPRCGRASPACAVMPAWQGEAGHGYACHHPL